MQLPKTVLFAAFVPKEVFDQIKTLFPKGTPVQVMSCDIDGLKDAEFMQWAGTVIGKSFHNYGKGEIDSGLY